MRFCCHVCVVTHVALPTPANVVSLPLHILVVTDVYVTLRYLPATLLLITVVVDFPLFPDCRCCSVTVTTAIR